MALSDMIAEGAKRLGLARRAVDKLDNRITRLEQDRRAAVGQRQIGIGSEIRELARDRTELGAVLELAEAQTAEREAEFRKVEDQAIRDLAKIDGEVSEAAHRADVALIAAAAAVAEVERLLEPLNLTLLPSGAIKRRCSIQTVDLAVRKAFQDRLGRLAQYTEQKSFANSIAMLMSSARENAGRIRRDRKEAA